jgi:hypothetical protein
MPKKYGAGMTAAQHRKNLLTDNPVDDKSKGMGGAGMSMGHKKPGMSMSGEKYDAKEAYNKNLSAKARLHYLENERHDKTHAHPILKHMHKM